VLTVQDARVVCLRVVCIDILKLPVYACLSRVWGRDIGSLIDQALRRVSAEELLEVETMVKERYARCGEGQSGSRCAVVARS
jgi:hypothetical protein